LSARLSSRIAAAQLGHALLKTPIVDGGQLVPTEQNLQSCVSASQIGGSATLVCAENGGASLYGGRILSALYGKTGWVPVRRVIVVMRQY
jgi:hypothetical protein